MSMSPKFAKFAAKTTGGAFDKARKEEARIGGCPLPVGAKGIAIVGKVNCTETKAYGDDPGGDPRIEITLEVDSPEEYRGKKITGSGLAYNIRATEKSTIEESFQRALDALEQLGLPREIRTEYKDFSECIEYFEQEPRMVEFLVVDDSKNEYNRSKKTVAFSAYLPGGNKGAEGSQEEEEDSNATYCTYLGARHKVLEDDGEILKIQSKSGKVREIAKSKVEDYNG